MQINKNIGLALFGIISFTVGFYISIIVFNYVPINFSKTISLVINPSSIFSTIIAVLLAYYVATTLARQNEKKNKKNTY